jgi:hypothetical protein
LFQRTRGGAGHSQSVRLGGGAHSSVLPRDSAETCGVGGVDIGNCRPDNPPAAIRPALRSSREVRRNCRHREAVLTGVHSG